MNYHYSEMTNNDNGIAVFFNLLIRHLLTLIVLNVIFLVCCIPVITIPASIVALNRAAWGLAKDQNKRIIIRFFKTFKGEFFRSIPLGIFFLGCQVGALYGAWFYYASSADTGAMMIPAFICLTIFLLFYMASIYAFPMIGVAKLSVRNVIKNAFVLVFMYPRKSIGVGTASFVLLFMGTWLYPHLVPVLAIILFSMVSFINVFFLADKIKKHILI